MMSNISHQARLPAAHCAVPKRRSPREAEVTGVVRKDEIRLETSAKLRLHGTFRFV